MDQFDKKLNDLLVDTFRSILKVEEQSLRSTGLTNLSISEMHLIEAVGREKTKTISDLAEEMDVTLPSVTVAINRLVKKGYVEKTKSGEDGRVVFVGLTRPGQKMNLAHRYFHEQMIKSVSREFSQAEKEILMNGVNRLNQFFKQKSADMRKK